MNKQPINTTEHTIINVVLPVKARCTTDICRDRMTGKSKGSVWLEFGELSISIDSGWIFESVEDTELWLKTMAEQITVKYADQLLFQGGDDCERSKD